MEKDQIKESIAKLVEKYNNLKDQNKINSYNEAQTRNEFIEPLFEFLGWDMRNLRNHAEVTTEEGISGGRADLAFRINGMPKFFLEAKAIRVDLDVEGHARQAINYSWNKGVTWAVLTDFESIKVFNAQAESRYLRDKLVFEIPCSEFIEDFDRLWLLSKEGFEKNALDVYAERHGKKSKKLTVNEKLFIDLKKSREILTRSFGVWNRNVDQENLDEGIQRILDRLVFIRVLEDRGLEEPILRPIVREWEKERKQQIFSLLIAKFRELDEIYNSNLFSKHACEDWEEHDDAIKKVIAMLYGDDMYEYDFKEIPADILGGVYEGYLGYIAQNPIMDRGTKRGQLFDLDSKNELKIKSRAKRKEHGIFYTPKFIVDYVVKNTLGEKLKEVKSMTELKNIRVLDPACGSGSFLTRALEEINNKYKDFSNPGDQHTKTEIILSNIYGVDLDSQAVELAKLNLLLDTLDKKAKLPTIKNVRVGNSLISGKDAELKKYFGKNWQEKQPFQWEEQFSDVFAQGGFDVIIGNPPYVNFANIADTNERKWLAEKYETAKNKSDLYSFFTEKGIKLLKDGGMLGFIFSNSWLGTDSFSKFREYLINNTTVYEMVKLPPGVFKGALVTTVLIFIKKQKPEIDHKIKLKEYTINGLVEIGELSYERIRKTPGYTFSFSKEVKFDVATVPLGDVAKFSLGIKTSNDKRFIHDKSVDEDSYKLLRGKDVFRYGHEYADKWIWYKPKLMMEKAGAGPRKLEYFLRDKIVIKDVAVNIIAALDDDKYLVNDTLNFIYEVEKFNSKFILALLNSAIVNKWFESTFPAGLHIKINQLENIPIPDLDFSNKEDKSKHDEIVALVEKMLNLQNQLQATPENSDKWNSVKDEIENTDKLIDSKVCELYGFKEDDLVS